MLHRVSSLRVPRAGTRKIPVCFFSTSNINHSEHVGFIGLGQMGLRMAKNLMKAGKNLVVYDVSKEPLDQLKAEGAKIAKTPKELAQLSQTIVTMLPSSPHVQKVYTDDESSLIHGLSAGKLCIDASTIDPNIARQVSQRLQQVGVQMVDAPVSGGIVGAQNATLTFMVGGSEESFNQAKLLLQHMGKNIVYCGGPGNGQVAKVCNNLVLGISMIAISEAMNLGITLGMDPKILAGIFNTSSARCWSSDTYNPVPGVIPGVPSSNGYKGGFAVDLMAKDLSLAVSAAHTVKQPLLLGGDAHQTYNLLSQQGYGGLDFSAVYKFLNEKKP
eukprot:TRINITY_DN9114_c0_g1_i1.p1 TRINITY_DN9114_c0_g1~~TRINITY_DN9114_c0_g1_i1.p1  ORF type:complete len:329 (+),score=59.94 TRINITY_DN9114_c0_g1_i1:36-1022(+)